MHFAFIVVVVLVTSACTLTAGVTSTTLPPRADTTTTSSPTATLPALSTNMVETRSFFERSCGSRISEGYGPEGTRRVDLHIGPIALLALDPDWLEAHAGDHYDPSPSGRFEGIKYVLVVGGSATGPVAVSITDEDRDTVRLVYDPERFHPTWEEADHTVKFEVCHGIDAQFNGGFVVRAPTCATIVVFDEGEDLTEWRAAIPFGVPPETCALS